MQDEIGWRVIDPCGHVFGGFFGVTRSRGTVNRAWIRLPVTDHRWPSPSSFPGTDGARSWRLPFFYWRVLSPEIPISTRFVKYKHLIMLLTKVEAILHNLNRVLEHGIVSNALDSAISSHILVGYCTKCFSAMRSISSVSVVFLFLIYSF